MPHRASTHHHLIGGIDEVGRGALAGPVFAAMAVFNPRTLDPDIASRIRDSKQLTKPQRQDIARTLTRHISFTLGAASVRDITQRNILQASLLAMGRAWHHAPHKPTILLIDGIHAPPIPSPMRTIPQGDAKDMTIAAASIIAKVARDTIMEKLAQRYPAYAWHKNAGYPTPHHQYALKHYGRTAHHRPTFRHVRSVPAYL
ncbi:MAG: ribonuclease HII [Alphaproteobacteria bacterium GM7ARS4]|nr:ribonuclease HII [Alphaproteobacteria bacterium GM7ARS4]